MTQHTDGRRGLPRRLRLAMAAGAAVLLLVILRKAAAQLLFQALLAVLLAWAARPLCARLERRLPAGIAALGALLTFLAALLGLLWLFVPQLLSQLSLAASAVPQLIDPLKKAVKIISGIDAMVVGAGIKTGLDIVLDDPGTIAADLVATAVAAKNEYPLPCIIIDMGTATTVTVVDAKGRYIGGAIMPGVRLSMHALADGTSLLPNIEITPPQKTIASNTIDCMKSGIIYGSAGALDGILDHYIDELGGSVGSVVATGGLASTICPMCRHAITLDSNLLLKGLYVIYQKNKAKKHRK